MKVLNLYAGIGGNRKLWPKECKVTAIENNVEIADIYKDLFPKDEVLVDNAHDYLLKHYKEFEFIWSSPPCPSHSDIRRCGVQNGSYKAIYPDMKLYEEIILLRHFSKCKWVVENVKPYYEPLIRPAEIGRHCFWSNFNITNFSTKKREHFDSIGMMEKVKGINLKKYKIKDKRKILRNCVHPDIGIHVINCAFKEKQEILIQQ